MPRKIVDKSNIQLKDIGKLLDQQTTVILSAVDERLSVNKIDILSAVDEKLSGLEKRISKLEIKVDLRFDQLITTLDKFLKRLADMEDEFEIMKYDINRLKKVIREKLGVDLT